jgi:hypothetical protein
MREQALKWWRGLTTDQQVLIVDKHFPDVAFRVISTSSMQIEKMYKIEIMEEWTSEDTEKATEEGWGLFECWGSENGSPQLQRIDEPIDRDAVFDSDESAWEFVYKGFLTGNKSHKKAFTILSKLNPKEFQLIKKHCESTITKDSLYNPV